jgi:hypothetical protein
MNFTKKKVTKIFSDGSINFNNIFFKKTHKVKISQKDHASFIFNKKNTNIVVSNSKDFENFKTRYLKF